MVPTASMTEVADEPASRQSAARGLGTRDPRHVPEKKTKDPREGLTHSLFSG